MEKKGKMKGTEGKRKGKEQEQEKGKVRKGI